MARTPWHPAVVQAFGNELEDCRQDLDIEAECQLTTEPLRIDVLIIKKKRDIVIKKNIARIFRQFNIIEYKSPEDNATAEDYNKTHAYARLYAALNKVDIADLTVTVATTRHPRKLLTFLKSRFEVQQEQQGIYIVKGEVYPTQIIVGAELSESDNFWLANLRNDLTAEQVAQVFTVAENKSETDAYIYAITNANAKALEELSMRRKKDVIFTEKLDAYLMERFAPRIAESEAKGKAEAVLTVLRTRFMKIPPETEKAIRRITDLVALDTWTAYATTCQSMTEFTTALRK